MSINKYSFSLDLSVIYFEHIHVIDTLYQLTCISSERIFWTRNHYGLSGTWEIKQNENSITFHSLKFSISVLLKKDKINWTMHCKKLCFTQLYMYINFAVLNLVRERGVSTVELHSLELGWLKHPGFLKHNSKYQNFSYIININNHGFLELQFLEHSNWLVSPFGNKS